MVQFKGLFSVRAREEIRGHRAYTKLIIAEISENSSFQSQQKQCAGGQMQVINFIHMGADIRERHCCLKRARLSFSENACCLLSLREWVSGFHDLLRDNPSTQFMPLVCSLISHHLPYNLIHVPGLLPTNYFSIHINQIQSP